MDTTLPQEIEPLSFAPLAALRAIIAAVHVRADELLVDLGCGRGGPGMWVARAMQARLAGVDSSPVAITQAQHRVATFGLRGRAQFLVGDLTATGLADASADGVMCIDSFPFAADHLRAAQEMLRILRPGRRLALTSWEARQPGDPFLPAMYAHLVTAEVLARAGFTSITVQEHPEWEQGRAAMYEAALAADAGTDRALQAFQASARQAFPLMPHLRRVLVIAERPTRVGR